MFGTAEHSYSFNSLGKRSGVRPFITPYLREDNRMKRIEIQSVASLFPLMDVKKPEEAPYRHLSIRLLKFYGQHNTVPNGHLIIAWIWLCLGFNYACVFFWLTYNNHYMINFLFPYTVSETPAHVRLNSVKWLFAFPNPSLIVV